MEKKDLYKYVIAVKAILAAEGQMSNEDFVKHALTCCKEAEGLNVEEDEVVREMRAFISDFELVPVR